ncbi:MAG TPA: histidine phosphatase family protein [Xanthomonadaceae bacterium]|jgi:broad specificity phosphatase PhoE
MADVLLIRHGQASFGAADYDRLSATGEDQSRLLGQWFGRIGTVPDLVVTGSMRRHARTAELCLETAAIDAPTLVVPGFDEMDHLEVLARHRPDLVAPGALVAELAAAADPQRAFQDLFAAAASRWTCGEHDGDYACTWDRFRTNVLAALQMLAGHAARRIWVFTSGGPIAVIVNALMGAPVDRTFESAWPLVNTSTTRIALGADRNLLLGYNMWPHLEVAGDASLVTYR